MTTIWNAILRPLNSQVRLRKYGRDACFCLAVAVMFLFAAEVAARVEDRLRLGVELFAVPDHDRDLILHDAIAVRGRPNGRFKKWALNNFGFRNAEMAKDPPEECVRVMVLGASESFGLYESQGKEYPAQLQGILRSGCYEVVNAAITGLTVRAIIQLWNRWGSEFAPDVVVVYPTPAFYLANNPPDDPRPPSGPVPAGPPPWTLRLIDRARDVIDMPAFIQRRRVARTLAGKRRNEPGWSFDSVPEERTRRFEEDLRTLVQSVQRSGARIVLLTHATGFGSPPKAAEQDALTAWLQFCPRASAEILLQFEAVAATSTKHVASQETASVVDVASKMNGHGEWFAEDYLHFNDAGAGVIAGLVADYILSDVNVIAHPARRQHHRLESD